MIKTFSFVSFNFLTLLTCSFFYSIKTDNTDLQPITSLFTFTTDDGLTIKAENLNTMYNEPKIFYNRTLTDWSSYNNTLGNLTTIETLSNSHLKGKNIQLKFNFLFYGRLIRNVYVTTNGYIYPGEPKDSLHGDNNFIAPLAAEFDLSLSKDSFVKYNDNGTAFTVMWENVRIQDNVYSEIPFIFYVTLNDNGDIIFAYQSIPTILDIFSYIKIGISTSYTNKENKSWNRADIMYEFEKKYFDNYYIQANTAIIFKDVCSTHKYCQACLQQNGTKVKCTWDQNVNKCHIAYDQEELKTNYCRLAIDYIQHPTPSAPTKTNLNLKNNTEIISNAKTIKSSGNGITLSWTLPLGFAYLIACWVFYAYKNADTKSGKILRYIRKKFKYQPLPTSGEIYFSGSDQHLHI